MVVALRSGEAVLRVPYQIHEILWFFLTHCIRMLYVATTVSADHHQWDDKIKYWINGVVYVSLKTKAKRVFPTKLTSAFCKLHSVNCC